MYVICIILKVDSCASSSNMCAGVDVYCIGSAVYPVVTCKVAEDLCLGAFKGFEKEVVAS